jgi:hypothetical protein
MSVQVIAPPAADEPSGRKGGRVCPSRAAIRSGRGHFSTEHALASVARRLCEQRHSVPLSARMGAVACGGCWEAAIRADERVAIEFGLPALAGEDAVIVDEIAVERAVAGDQDVRLNREEKRAAIAVLAGRGFSHTGVSKRLAMSGSEVIRLWPVGGSR